MKTFLAILNMVIAIQCSALDASAPKAARSVHLHYAPLAPLPQSVMATVTVTETYTNSYFMTIGWGCGYCGLQDLGKRGHVFIFSVWDHGDFHDPNAKESAVKEANRARVLYSAPGVQVARFENEGTGARTMTWYDWKIGEPIDVRIDSEPDGETHMAYTCHIRQSGGEWRKVATLSTICTDPNERGINGVHSFVEDFWRNGVSAKMPRSAEYSNIQTKSKDGEWVKAEKAFFTADNTPTTNVDAGRTESGAFFLKTGGDTKNDHTPLFNVVE